MIKALLSLRGLLVLVLASLLETRHNFPVACSAYVFYFFDNARLLYETLGRLVS